MGYTTEIKTKVLSGELFLGMVALKMPTQKHKYKRDMGPFPTYGHYIEKLENFAAVYKELIN